MEVDMPHENSTEESRFRRFRARRKAQGMKELRLWVPDTRRPDFIKEIRRQLTLTEETPDDQETLSLIEDTADWSE